MCILLTTTANKDYPFILLSNRDEYFVRPTALALPKSLPDGLVLLAPYDLARPERGTWIGITSGGRIAVLVNYRQNDSNISEVSRGILPVAYLKSTLDDETWFLRLESQLGAHAGRESVPLSSIGGFLLLYGTLKLTADGIEPLNIMGNRGDRGKVHCDYATEAHPEFARQSTFGLSNSLYYKPWPKVESGRAKLELLARRSTRMAPSEMAQACFDILSTDTYSRSVLQTGSWVEKLHELQNTIFIPPVPAHDTATATMGPTMGAYYGTRTQTVVLLHRSGKLHYFERDLHREDSDKVEVREQHYEYFIEGPRALVHPVI